MTTSRSVDTTTARQISVAAALLGAPPLPPTTDSVLEVARHFGGIQIDPTRTVERTQHLVLWSRISGYDRKLLDRVLAERRAFEFDAFIVPVERLPELRHVARTWLDGAGAWRLKTRRFIDGNGDLRRSRVGTRSLAVDTSAWIRL